jgi:hypothetical protein
MLSQRRFVGYLSVEMIMAEATSIPLVVELWYAENAPDLEDPRLLEALRRLSPDAEPQTESVVVPHGDGSAPLLTVIMPVARSARVARRCLMSAKPGIGRRPKPR